MSVVGRNVVANLLGKGWNAVLTIGFVPVALHFVGVEGYGLLALLANLQALALIDFGLSLTLTRELARQSVAEQEANDLVRTFEWLTWGIAALLVGLVLLLPGWVLLLWVRPAALSPMTVVASVVLIGAIVAIHYPMNVYLAGLSGLQHQVLNNAVTTGFATLRVGVGVAVLALSTDKVPAILTWYAVVFLAQAVVCRELLRRSLPRPAVKPQFRYESLRRVWVGLAGMAGILATGILWMQMDRLILPAILSLDGYARYSLAALLASIPILIAGPISAAILPRFTQLGQPGKQRELSEFYHTMTQVMAVLALPLAVVIALFSRPLLLAWTGDPVEAQTSWAVVTLLSVANAWQCLMCLPYHLLVGRDTIRPILWANLLAVSVTIPMVVALGTAVGAVGVAAFLVVLNLCYAVALAYLTHWLILPGEQARWYLCDIAPPLLGALLSAGACRLLLPEFEGRWPILVGVGCVGLVVLTVSALCSPRVVGWVVARIRALCPSRSLGQT